VPPTPPYLRAKVLRRLKQVGALALKKSAYLLPNSEDAREDFQWILKEISGDGGEAWVLEAEAVAGLTDESIRQSFRELRADDYRELLVEIRSSGDLHKIRKRYEEVVKIDFFHAPGKEEVATMLRQTEPGGASAPAGEFRGNRWVTRRGIKVDRSACCWLIRRFIDPAAEIAFVDPDKYRHRDGEVRFDMFEGEITHEGDLCSFEVLAQRAGLSDAGIQVIGEIVHDLDLKEEKFERAENAGVAAMLAGIAARHTDDQCRMDEALVLFDALYATAAGPSPSA
jgi:hypothetical protein